jgi:iron-sulfur cluster assembly accessory protein
MITVTQAAIHHLRELVSEDPSNSDKGLRIFVEDGGCAGRQYGMQFDYPKSDDHRVENDGVAVLIDPKSAEFLRGATVDFTDGLTGSGFRIDNPNVVRSCGCGSSFEVSEEKR